MTFAELQQAFRDWTLTATGLAGSVVYWTHQDVPRPDGPCLSLHVRNPGRQRGHDGGHVSQTASGEDGEVERDFYGYREATVSLSAYGATAYDVIEALRRAVHTDTGQGRARELALAVLISDPQSVPAMVDGQRYEERVIADARVSYVATYTDVVTPIDTINAANEAGEDFIFSASVDTEP